MEEWEMVAEKVKIHHGDSETVKALLKKSFFYSTLRASWVKSEVF